MNGYPGANWRREKIGRGCLPEETTKIKHNWKQKKRRSAAGSIVLGALLVGVSVGKQRSISKNPISQATFGEISAGPPGATAVRVDLAVLQYGSPWQSCKSAVWLQLSAV